VWIVARNRRNSLLRLAVNWPSARRRNDGKTERNQ
jgi:hypothetical protein